MTTASFFKKNGKFYKFRVSGHSGYSEEGSDIVCAAVSSMVMITVNNIAEGFGIPCKVSSDEENAVVECSLDVLDERGCILIAGLEREMRSLADGYPEFVGVTVK